MSGQLSLIVAQQNANVNSNKTTPSKAGVECSNTYLSNSRLQTYCTMKLMATKTTAPLALHQRDYIIQLLALGNTKAQIVDKFEKKYGRRINPVTVQRLKKREGVKEQVDEAQNALVGRGEQLGPALLKQKAYQQLNRKLDRAAEDETEIDKLRARLRAGEIDKKTFDTECARYEVLTTNELIKIADATHQHAKQDGDDPALTPQDHAALQMLMTGIQSGNPVQLIQILNPNLHVNPTAGSPAPPAGTPA